MTLFTLDELEDATAIVRSLMPPTPSYAWPLLAQRAGPLEVVVPARYRPSAVAAVMAELAAPVKAGLTKTEGCV